MAELIVSYTGTARYSVEEPDVFKHPELRWYRGTASFVLSWVKEVFYLLQPFRNVIKPKE